MTLAPKQKDFVGQVIDLEERVRKIETQSSSRVMAPRLWRPDNSDIWALVAHNRYMGVPNVTSPYPVGESYYGDNRYGARIFHKLVQKEKENTSKRFIKEMFLFRQAIGALPDWSQFSAFQPGVNEYLLGTDRNDQFGDLYPRAMPRARKITFMGAGGGTMYDQLMAPNSKRLRWAWNADASYSPSKTDYAGQHVIQGLGQQGWIATPGQAGGYGTPIWWQRMAEGQWVNWPPNSEPGELQICPYPDGWWKFDDQAAGAPITHTGSIGLPECAGFGNGSSDTLILPLSGWVFGYPKPTGGNQPWVASPTGPPEEYYGQRLSRTDTNVSVFAIGAFGFFSNYYMPLIPFATFRDSILSELENPAYRSVKAWYSWILQSNPVPSSYGWQTLPLFNNWEAVGKGIQIRKRERMVEMRGTVRNVYALGRTTSTVPGSQENMVCRVPEALVPGFVPGESYYKVGFTGWRGNGQPIPVYLSPMYDSSQGKGMVSVDTVNFPLNDSTIYSPSNPLFKVCFDGIKWVASS